MTTYSALRDFAQHLELGSSEANNGGHGEGEKLHVDDVVGGGIVRCSVVVGIRCIEAASE